MKDGLLKEQVIEKFEIERVYWERRQIDWGIVTELEIYKGMARNISYIHDCFDIQQYDAFQNISSQHIEDLAMSLLQRILNESQSIREITNVFDKKESYVYIVNIDANKSMPKKELYSSLVTDIEQKEWLIFSDSFARAVVEEELTEVQIQKRNADWEIIQTYCLEHMNNLLQKNGREINIKEIAEEVNFTPTKVKKLLSRLYSE